MNEDYGEHTVEIEVEKYKPNIYTFSFVMSQYSSKIKPVR